MQIIEYLGSKYQNVTNDIRVWSAGIVMALVTIMKKTAIQFMFNIDAFKVMFTYLCLEKNQREHVVGLMDNPLRSVMQIHKYTKMFNFCLCREEVANSIVYVCSLLISHDKANGLCHWDWLYAVPLLHELQSQDKVTQDWDRTFADPENVDWGVNGLDRVKLQDFKNLVHKKRYC